MYNPIYYKADQFTLDEAKSGFAFLSDDGTQKAYGGDYKACTWAYLTDDNGVSFIYVNVHLNRKPSQSELDEGAENYQDDVVGYFKALLVDLAEQYACPIIIGGDFNASYSVLKGYDSYWGDTAVSVKDEATNTTTGCSTTTSDFLNLGSSSGAIDLYFALNAENVDFHSYAVTDNKVEETGKYPSDHLPIIMVATIYGEN